MCSSCSDQLGVPEGRICAFCSCSICAGTSFSVWDQHLTHVRHLTMRLPKLAAFTCLVLNGTAFECFSLHMPSQKSICQLTATCGRIGEQLHDVTCEHTNATCSGKPIIRGWRQGRGHILGHHSRHCDVHL